jgi:hypothetical protein
VEGRAAVKLGERQRLLTKLLPRLIDKAYELGYELTLGDGYRDPRVFGAYGEFKGYGKGGSCHKLRLAVDLNLFRDGKYLAATEDHRPLGEFWELLHPECRWGGRFYDGNHYEIKAP